MLSFVFETRELERFGRELGRFADEIPALGSEEIVRQVREFAALSKAPDGSQWITLTEAYRRRKIALGQPGIPNKRLTGQFLMGIKARRIDALNFVISPADRDAGKAAGLERLRISFQVAPVSANIVEAILLKRYNEINA